MPVITVYRHGGMAGIAPSKTDSPRARRGHVQGWSKSSIRSNQRFLYKVDETQLTGQGWTFTLTLRTCPDTHTAWHSLLRAFFERLRRMGMIRLHWVVEWQSRGVPHLHGCVWFDEAVESGYLLVHWMTLTREHYQARAEAQDMVSISNAVGWFQYLSKHAARGLRHYQRSPGSMPSSWYRTGRMWGHCGNWPLADVTRISVDTPCFHAYRRVIRAWRKADAREGLEKLQRRVRQGIRAEPHVERSARRRVQSARTMLRCGSRKRSTVRGVSEWVSRDVQLDILVSLVINKG